MDAIFYWQNIWIRIWKQLEQINIQTHTHVCHSNFSLDTKLFLIGSQIDSRRSILNLLLMATSWRPVYFQWHFELKNDRSLAIAECFQKKLMNGTFDWWVGCWLVGWLVSCMVDCVNDNGKAKLEFESKVNIIVFR